MPWQGMLWVTWRQHRGLLIIVPAVFSAAVAFMLITGQKIHHDYTILTACHPAASPACVQLNNYFNSTDWHYGNGIRVALLAAPVLLALFAGPPVVARNWRTARSATRGPKASAGCAGRSPSSPSSGPW